MQYFGFIWGFLTSTQFIHTQIKKSNEYQQHFFSFFKKGI